MVEIIPFTKIRTGGTKLSWVPARITTTPTKIHAENVKLTIRIDLFHD